jgi:hypothetical protein
LACDVSHDNHGAYAARDVHGETIWMDAKVDRVIVRFASHPITVNAASGSTSLLAYQAVVNHLMANDGNPLTGDERVIAMMARPPAPVAQE